MYMMISQNEFEDKVDFIGQGLCDETYLRPFFYAWVMALILVVLFIQVPGDLMDRAYRKQSGIGMEVLDERERMA